MIIIIIHRCRFMYPYQRDCYEHAIRVQDHRQDVELINYYVQIGMQVAKQSHSASATKRVYLRLILTFEETMCDSLLSEKWRMHCYRVIKRLTLLSLNWWMQNNTPLLLPK